MGGRQGLTFESHIFSVALFFDNGLFDNRLFDGVLFRNVLFNNVFFDNVLFGNIMVTIDRRTVDLAVSVDIAV
jgi:hypothetical protein